MRRMETFGLHAHANFGPLVVPLVTTVASAFAGAAASKLLAPKAPKSPLDSGGPQPPQPPTPAQGFSAASKAQPFFGALGSALLGSKEGSFGGTFLSGSAAKPNLKKTLLGQ